MNTNDGRDLNTYDAAAYNNGDWPSGWDAFPAYQLPPALVFTFKTRTDMERAQTLLGRVADASLAPGLSEKAGRELLELLVDSI